LRPKQARAGVGGSVERLVGCGPRRQSWRARCELHALPLKTLASNAQRLEAFVAKKKPASHRVEYSKDDIRQLRTLIRSKTPMAEIAKTLGRTPAAVRMKARTLGITTKRAKTVVAKRARRAVR